ncbi:TSUP family transporter [Pontibacterium granulatum]|uniref:TSUP family transporter n=1 Tax=Pontibacterium granulatum TaxID=2036029 RepID=UPI002499EFBB|nr:TSUP family transporter [Pontibacterium granulatum]MDI3323255.1 TSUP family transporter [Pontibacterium granulatum]
MPELSFELIALLTLAATAAGFIDAVAGGGGLITIPALIFSGIPPVEALATNKLQGSFGSFSATLYFVRRKMVIPSNQGWALMAAAAGAASGAVAIQWFSTDWLLKVMPFALIAIALYLLIAHKAGYRESKAKLSEKSFNASLIPGIGFYDGFFGPGTGTFFTLGYCQLRGMNMLQATAHTKLMNFTTNILSLAVFVLSGKIMWSIGLSMAVGQFVGARLGAATALRQGVGFIRLMTVGVCIAISISLWLKQ